MSWSVSMMGKPEKVVEALKAESDKLSGQSKEEYDAALPHLIGLVEQNAAEAANPDYPKIVTLNAGGHGSKNKDGQWVERNCTTNLSTSYTRVLI